MLFLDGRIGEAGNMPSGGGEFQPSSPRFDSKYLLGPIPLTREGAADLSQFLWDSVAKNQAGAPVRAGDGPYPQSVFYAATGTYDASNTCNSWTAEALRAAGVPVTAAGVVFAAQPALRRLRLRSPDYAGRGSQGGHGQKATPRLRDPHR